MPNLYARKASLTDLTGRIDYISNPKRQENLLATYDGAADQLQGDYWKLLAKESQAAFDTFGRSDTKCRQGREIHGQLPNSLLHRMEPEKIAQILAKDFEIQYGRPAMVAIHLNKSKTNLHFHLIYSDRELLAEPVVKTATRALFFDEEGKRHYKKGEILDESGELRPGCKIVAKGEVYDRRCFGPVDQIFCSRRWLSQAKTDWLLPLLNGPLKGDTVYREYDPTTGKLPQQHVGKSAPEALRRRIRHYNRLVKEYNSLIDYGSIPQQVAMQLQSMLRSDAISVRQNVLETFLKKYKENNKPRINVLISGVENRQKENRAEEDLALYVLTYCGKVFFGMSEEEVRKAMEMEICDEEARKARRELEEKARKLAEAKRMEQAMAWHYKKLEREEKEKLYRCMYDQKGHKRSLTEQLYLLAATICNLDEAELEWINNERERDFSHDIMHMADNTRLQRMADELTEARKRQEEGR